MLGRRGQRKLLRMVHGEQSGVREGNDFGGRRRLGRLRPPATLLHRLSRVSQRQKLRPEADQS